MQVTISSVISWFHFPLSLLYSWIWRFLCHDHWNPVKKSDRRNAPCPCRVKKRVFGIEWSRKELANIPALDQTTYRISGSALSTFARDRRRPITSRTENETMETFESPSVNGDSHPRYTDALFLHSIHGTSETFAYLSLVTYCTTTKKPRVLCTHSLPVSPQ